MCLVCLLHVAVYIHCNVIESGDFRGFPETLTKLSENFRGDRISYSTANHSVVIISVIITVVKAESTRSLLYSYNL